MVTKLFRAVIYCGELPPIKLHGPLMKWSCVFTRQIEYIICQFAEAPWMLN